MDAAYFALYLLQIPSGPSGRLRSTCDIKNSRTQFPIARYLYPSALGGILAKSLHGELIRTVCPVIFFQGFLTTLNSQLRSNPKAELWAYRLATICFWLTLLRRAYFVHRPYERQSLRI